MIAQKSDHELKESSTLFISLYVRESLPRLVLCFSLYIHSLGQAYSNRSKWKRRPPRGGVHNNEDYERHTRRLWLHLSLVRQDRHSGTLLL